MLWMLRTLRIVTLSRLELQLLCPFWVMSFSFTMLFFCVLFLLPKTLASVPPFLAPKSLFGSYLAPLSNHFPPFLRTLDTFDPETLREQGIFRPLCGRTPLEAAVSRGWSEAVGALFQAPELANGMAQLRLRLQVVARHLPHWPKETKDKAAIFGAVRSPI